MLLGLEPELDCGNPQQALAALKQAALVVMLTPFKSAAMAEYADVLLPVAPFTETSGSYVNTEGRVQSFTGVVRAAGESRPAWKVLRVLGNVLAIDGFEYASSEAVRDALLPAITADAPFVSGLDNVIGEVSFAFADKVVDLQRVADVPIHFADALVRRAPSLQKTRDGAAPVARMSAATLAKLGIADGDAVRVKQGDGVASLLAKCDATMRDDCVGISAAHPSTAMLGDMFGTITVERA